MADSEKTASPKAFSKTADLKLALRAHCEQRLRALLTKHGAPDRALPELLLQAKAASQPNLDPAFRKQLGAVAKLLDGVLGREFDRFTESLPEFARSMVELSTKLPPIFDQIFGAMADLSAATIEAEAASAPFKVLNGLRPEWLDLKRATVESMHAQPVIRALTEVAESKTPAELVRTLEGLVAQLPDHPNKGAVRALLTVMRWRSEALSQARDFEILSGLVSVARKPRFNLVRQFEDGFLTRVGSEWAKIPFTARDMACLSILCGHLPKIIEGFGDLRKPTLNPPLKLRLVLDRETQTMRVHLRELKGTRKNP